MRRCMYVLEIVQHKKMWREINMVSKKIINMSQPHT